MQACPAEFQANPFQAALQEADFRRYSIGDGGDLWANLVRGRPFQWRRAANAGIVWLNTAILSSGYSAALFWMAQHPESSKKLLWAGFKLVLAGMGLKAAIVFAGSCACLLSEPSCHTRLKSR